MKILVRILTMVVCMILLALPIFEGFPEAGAVSANDVLPQKHYGDYLTLNNVPDSGSCYSMQGMTVGKDYAYCAKIGSNDAVQMISRISKTDGSRISMTNAATGTIYFTNLGHANALDITYLGGCDQLFVTAGATLVRLTINGTTLTTAGTYTFRIGDTATGMTAVQIMCAEEDVVQVIAKSGKTLYTGTLDPRASSGEIVLTKLCMLNLINVRVNRVEGDYSSWTQQGFDYHDNKIFLPLFANTTEKINTSVVLVYDIAGATGNNLYSDPSLSFRVTSGNYSALFEIEDVCICQQTGRLYFTTNRRKTNADTNYDSCSYFYGYTYQPDMSTLTAGDYRWETEGNTLKTVVQGGNIYNNPTRFYGSVSDEGVMSNALYNLERSVRLQHDSPWVVEWKSSGDFGNGAFLLAAGMHSRVVDAPFLFRYKQSSVIAFGYYNGQSHLCYGITLSDYGIDGTAEHVYRLTNKIAADGSNMIYLSVDGRELGAMNNYYIAYYDQGKTDNWVSGRDFSFSYLGSYNHPLSNVKLDYLQVWADGVPDPPDVYRWETQNDALTEISGDGLTPNKPYMYTGTVSGGSYSNATHRLTDSVILLHDRPWSLEWQSEGVVSGGTYLFAAMEGQLHKDAPYIYRYGSSGLLSIGRYDGSSHQRSGLNLADYGIDGTQSHVYRLTNKIAADGSNMVWLSVDGQELGPMNRAYEGTTDLGTTTDYLVGQDLCFDYLGTWSGTMKAAYSYLQVWEDGVPCSYEFRDEDGTLLSSGTLAAGQVPPVPQDPVKTSDQQYRYEFDGWSPQVGAMTEDTVYTAQYIAIPNSYTVTFVDEDGSLLQSETLPYGTIPTPPEAPTKEPTQTHTFSFKGWDKALSAVTGDVTYTAQYYSTLRKYTITFLDEDGTLLFTTSTAYGTYPAVSQEPTKTGGEACFYTFAGWSPELYPITGEETFTANYQATPHSYGEGVCSGCGAKDPDYVPPLAVPTISLRYPTLSFEDVIIMNVYYTAENLENVAEMGLLTYTEKISSVSVETADAVIPGYDWSVSDGLYYSTTQGIAAKCLGDTIYFAVYYRLTDSTYGYTNLVGYSPKSYAYNQLKTGSAEMKPLVVAMLNYGAAAQTYFGYKTDSLMNADLTAAQKALVASYSGTMVESVTQASGTKLGQFVNNGGYTRRYPTISFEGAFCINYYFIPSAAVKGNVTMYVWNYTDYSQATTLTKANATEAVTMTLTESGEYLAVVENIAAKDLDKAIYVSFCYSDGTTDYCAGVIGYSIGAYCASQASKTGALADLAAACAVYGYYAKELFYE